MQCVVSTVLLARVAFVLLFHSIADKLKRLCNKPFVFVQLEKYAPSWASTAVTPDVATEENSEDSQFRANLAKVCYLPCVSQALCRFSCVGCLRQVLNVPTTRVKKMYLTPYQWRAAWDRLVFQSARSIVALLLHFLSLQVRDRWSGCRAVQLLRRYEACG